MKRSTCNTASTVPRTLLAQTTVENGTETAAKDATSVEQSETAIYGAKKLGIDSA